MGSLDGLPRERRQIRLKENFWQRGTTLGVLLGAAIERWALGVLLDWWTSDSTLALAFGMPLLARKIPKM